MHEQRSELTSALQLYGWQSSRIDEGAAEDWADTFTPDGRFESPSYPEPVQGREDLIAFARRFAENSPRTRHVMTNVHIIETPSREELVVGAYLLIARTSSSQAVEILRLTTIRDDLVRIDGQWMVRRRKVSLEQG